MSTAEFKSQKLYIKVVIVKIFENQLKLITAIFGVDNINGIFFILILTKLFFCIQ